MSAGSESQSIPLLFIFTFKEMLMFFNLCYNCVYSNYSDYSNFVLLCGGDSGDMLEIRHRLVKSYMNHFKRLSLSLTEGSLDCC